MLFDDTIKIKNPTNAEIWWLIQFFEITFELSWKLLKDYLESNWYTPKWPRDVIKQSFQDWIISDWTVWLNALQDRNLTVHKYSEEQIMEIKVKIVNLYFAEIKKLYKLFKEKNDE